MTIYHKKCNIVKYIIFFLPVILYSFSWLSRLEDQIVRTNTEVDVGIWNDQNTFIFIINDEKDVKLIFEHPVIKGSKGGIPLKNDRRISILEKLFLYRL